MAELLQAPCFKVIVFVGANQPKVNFDLVAAFQGKGADVRYIKIGGTGSNALDFHIAYYIGELAAADPNAYFHVITCDRGMDPLIAHLKNEKGLRVSRSLTIQDITALTSKADSAAPEDEKLSIALAYLVHRGKQRPTKVKTLIGSISALFNPRLDEASAQRLLDELEKNGIFVRTDNKVIYSLPD
jgi:PIN domain